MLDIDTTTTKPADRSINRHSWSSDSPSSSSNSVRSGKDSKGSLWSKLRKQASRMHSSTSHHGSAFSTAQQSRSSVSVEPRSTWAMSMDQPRPTTASGGRRNAGMRAGHLGAGSMDNGVRPATAHSMDIPRRTMFRSSTDIQPAGEGAGRPRFRRMLLGAADQGPKPLAPMNFIEQQHPAAGLARIAEDDEHPGPVALACLQPPARYYPAVRTDAKRFSENSGSTVSSSDTVGDPSEPLRLRLSINLPTAPAVEEKFVPSPTREHPPELLPLAHGKAAAKDVPLDPLVYRNTFFNARPLTDQQNLELAIRRNTAYRPLSKRASDDTLGTLARSADPLPGSGGGGGQPSGASVRFAEASEVIHEAGKLTSSMPSLARSSSATKPPSAKPRRPSEPTRPSTWRDALEAAPQGSLAEADAEYNRRMVAEVVALKRTVRTLRLQNDVLAEVARKDCEDVPESVATRMRTLELENRWLRNELSRLRATHQ
ncbi:hypothetical protein GGI15_002800 [Coemansia interrupta]|uniref:Uncharacterized protein n=1 Tax=Coemansia interrupta TaxID=1126814 RepID=A0A9W8HD06_9FUNG|nr:hypothetical protein GGI15_002800 [Coemansia interrupta]